MADSDQEQGEEKKSSKKMIIIIAGVVLLLGGGGGGYYFMSAGDEAAAPEEVAEVEQEPEKEPEELVYYDMANAFTVNYPKGSPARLLQIAISLSVEGESSIEDFKKHEPMIRNNILMLMSAQDAATLKGREGKEKLRSSMLGEINTVMQKMTKEKPAKNLFFTAFVMQ